MEIELKITEEEKAEILSEAMDNMEKLMRAGVTLRNIPKRGSRERVLAVALAISGHFDDYAEEVISRGGDNENPGTGTED